MKGFSSCCAVLMSIAVWWVSSAAQERVRIAPSSPGLAARPVQFAAKEGFFAREGLTPEIIVMRTNTGVAALVTAASILPRQADRQCARR
jgi:hypothetical protein